LRSGELFDAAVASGKVQCLSWTGKLHGLQQGGNSMNAAGSYY
jgi:hypothetical protein